MDVSESTLAADVARRTEDKVVEGKDGWLFLGHDTNHVIFQHTGQLRFDLRQLEDWRHVLEHRYAWLAHRGVPYHFIVPPNTHSVYPEYLPDWVVPVADRPVIQLLGHLHETESPARIMYPLDEIIAHKEHDLVCIQADTHWNELAAYIAYKPPGAARSPARASTFAIIPWERADHQPQRADRRSRGEAHTPACSTHVFVDVSDWRAHYRADNRIQYAGRRVEYTCERAPETTLFLHGDSFSEKMLHLLGESFGRVVFCQMPSLDYEVVSEVKPDVVIGLLNERFLLQVPYDATAPTQRELEEMKRLQGTSSAPASRRVAEAGRDW